MRTWLLNSWDSLRTNFWFMPSLLVALAVVLSFVTIHLDKATSQFNWVAALGWTFTRGPEGSRAVLSTVAGSMITIASVTFSITIVALQLASSQFGPRLLRNFMRDRGNQVALGAFIATFTYCLPVLRTVNGTQDQVFVPHFSVTVGLVLALASLGVLIYFIHHAAALIQADQVIASVGQELHEAIERLFPEGIGQEAPAVVKRCESDVPEDFERQARTIVAETSDYLQAIDEDGLMRIARDKDVVLQVVFRPGKFVTVGAALVRVWPADRSDEELVRAIRGVFYFGRQRTLTQDVEFAIDQLVEIALRALSPGINDPFTAMTCIDRLGAAFSVLAGRQFPSACRYDDQDRLRIIADAVTAPGLVDAAFHQLRQAAATNVAVTLRLLETLATIAAHARERPFREALLHHATLIYRGSRNDLPEEWDRQEADQRYQAVLRAMAEAEDVEGGPGSQPVAGALSVIDDSRAAYDGPEGRP